MAERLFELIYPPVCPFCGKLVYDGICKECEKKLPYITEPRCKCCGGPVRKEEQEFCLDCQSTKHFFEEGRNLWLHRPPVNEAVYAFKYQNRKIYAGTFGKKLAENYGTYLKEKQIELMLPIPLHKKRERKRGFNQSWLLAEALSKETGIPARRDVLKRIKETTPQKELDNRQRRRNIRGAFEVSEYSLYAKKILLVDDIYTTGSTLDEAAKVLLLAGAEKVYFLTISIGQGF